MFTPDTPTDSINALSELSNRPEPANRAEAQAEMSELALNLRYIQSTLKQSHDPVAIFNQTPALGKAVLTALTRGIDVMRPSADGLKSFIPREVINNLPKPGVDRLEIEYTNSCKDVLGFLDYLSSFKTNVIHTGTEYRKAPLYNLFARHPKEVVGLFNSLAKLSVNCRSNPSLSEVTGKLLKKFYKPDDSEAINGEDKGFFRIMLENDRNNSANILKVFENFTSIISSLDPTSDGDKKFDFFRSNFNFFASDISEIGSNFYKQMQNRSRKIIQSFPGVLKAIKLGRGTNAKRLVELIISQNHLGGLGFIPCKRSERGFFELYSEKEVSELTKLIGNANRPIQTFLEEIKFVEEGISNTKEQ